VSKTATKYFTPFGVDIDLVDGAMAEPDRRHVTPASKMRGYYADEAALEGIILQNDDPTLYEVFEKNVPEEYGHVLFCISRLLPGRIGDECAMTKGHYHTILGTAESYLCISGTGFMMLKTPDGHCLCEPFHRGRLVYVPPCWAHRSINTGETPLVSLCHYQADAGHNYGDIVTEGFPKRVFDRGGSIVVE
jgi:glucose-6-phosphate isomerase, archaeal